MNVWHGMLKQPGISVSLMETCSVPLGHRSLGVCGSLGSSPQCLISGPCFCCCLQGLGFSKNLKHLGFCADFI